MKLVNVLEMIDRDSAPVKDLSDVRDVNQGSIKVKLCFMSEEETWVTLYPGHPILIPFYECEVAALGVEDNIMMIWLNYEEFLEKFIKNIEDEKEA